MKGTRVLFGLFGVLSATILFAAEEPQKPVRVRETGAKIDSSTRGTATASFFRGVRVSGLKIRYRELEGGWTRGTFHFPPVRARWIKIQALPAGDDLDPTVKFDLDHVTILGREWEDLRADKRADRWTQSLVLDLKRARTIDAVSLSLKLAQNFDFKTIFYVSFIDGNAPKEADLEPPFEAKYAVPIADIPAEVMPENQFYFTKRDGFTALTISPGKIAPDWKFVARHFEIPPTRVGAIQIEGTPQDKCAFHAIEVNAVSKDGTRHPLNTTKVYRVLKGVQWLSKSRHELDKPVLAEGIELTFASVQEGFPCRLNVYLFPGHGARAGEIADGVAEAADPEAAVAKVGQFEKCVCNAGLKNTPSERKCFLIAHPPEPPEGRRMGVPPKIIAEAEVDDIRDCDPKLRDKCQKVFRDRAAMCVSWQ